MLCLINARLLGAEIVLVSHLNNFSAQQTADFVLSAVAHDATILDVGCGDGRISALLAAAGLRVHAIDARDDVVKEAVANGVKAECADFLSYSPSTKFDAILFARSLHHISPLGDAVAHTHELLAPNGLLLLDDFAAEAVDMQTAIWFYGLKSLLGTSHELHSRGPKLDDGKMPADPLAAWREHLFGRHAVSPSTAYLSAVRGRFTIASEARIPYLFRYFSDDLSESECAALQDWETRLCHWGALRPIGVRVIARAIG